VQESLTVRLRRLPSRRFRRRRYEVEVSGPRGRVVRTTRTPATEIDGYLGTGDAWALVHAADNDPGEWVRLTQAEPMPADNHDRKASPEEVAAEVCRWFNDKGYEVELRPSSDGFVLDLVSGTLRLDGWASGPDEALAVIAGEQRWLVEQEGSGSVPGDTYVDKARERLRRAAAG
jgi:hypothetical protein